VNRKEYYKQASIRNQRINWVKIRNEYETTDISLRRLVQKYKNLKFSTLESRCKREGWVKSKKETQYKLHAKVRQKTIKNIATTEAKVLENHFNISDDLLNIVKNSLVSEKEFNTFVDTVKSGDSEGNFEEEIKEFVLKSINDKKLLNMVNAFEKLQKAQRQTLNIVDGDKLTRQDKLKETKHKQSMDNAKFEQDKQEHADKMAMEEKKINNDIETNDKPIILVDSIKERYERNKS
jgi:hypothetical protein